MPLYFKQIRQTLNGHSNVHRHQASNVIFGLHCQATFAKQCNIHVSKRLHRTKLHANYGFEPTRLSTMFRHKFNGSFR